MENREVGMSEDYDGDYAGIVLQVMEAKPPLGDVVSYLDKQQRYVYKVRKENEELREENIRLHARNNELHQYLGKERRRVKPDKDLVSKKVLELAIDLLEIGDVMYCYEAGDYRYQIERIKRRTHDEEVNDI